MSIIVSITKRRRGPFGFVLKWLFILWNIVVPGLILLAIVKSGNDVLVGSLLASGILGIYVFGALILGLLCMATRGKIITTQRTA